MIEYFLWPPRDEQLVRLSDDFAVHGCRVRLMGSAFTVECESGYEAQAEQIATAYVQALREQSLFFGRALTRDEYAAMPAQPIHFQGKSERVLANDLERLRDARRAVVAHVHPRLSQCYDYLQLAREEPKGSLFHLYKLVESIEGEYGSETQAIKALDAGAQIKSLKRQANQPEKDQRHAPTNPTAIQPIDPSALARLVEIAHELVRKYENAIGAAPPIP